MNRQRHILGRARLHIPNLRGSMVAVAKRVSWSRLLLGLFGGAIMVVLIAFLVIRHSFSSAAPVVVATEAISSSVIRNPLTGEKIDSPLTSLPQVFGVMVENSSDAWPLSGLNDAFLVIEAPVEGNIPRFISFFAEGQEVKQIGPVRSARPYYLDWADELQALYAHVGGSPEALDDISKNGTTKDLNQFFQGEYFWRNETTRYAPHNVYTSTTLLTSALDEVGRKDLSYSPWSFKDASPIADAAAAISPTIDWMDGSTYDVTWKYDAATNEYDRYQGSSLFKMSNGVAIVADNVVIMEATVTTVDEKGRHHVVTVGSGNAYFYQDGKKIITTWKKPSRTERLKFYDQNEGELAFNAGKTWIEVIPSLTKVGQFGVTK